ncbi:MAG: haloacid dehalogenase-like hydrolase [Candidatus Cloacimonetes bacterium]|nr:haloacid dehalogenase-like hydrolase [Candidatus Cloacimonadota bacterium]
MSKIIFFDINGTIIKRNPDTDISFEKAIDGFLEITDGMKGVDNSARSDKDVFMEVLANNQMELNEELWNGFLDLYKHYLDEYYLTDIWCENADALEFIKQLVSNNCNLALITGELSVGAEYKLRKIGVWNSFPCGGFGEDALSRFDIADVALQRAREYFQQDFDEIIVIGDTILDIKTAKHLGAKIISISTGSNSKEELAEFQPDYLISKFSEIDLDILI